MQGFVITVVLLLACGPFLRLCYKSMAKGDEISPLSWRRSVYTIFAGVITLIVGDFLMTVWVTSLWFEEVKYAQRYWTVLQAMCTYFAYAFIVTEVFFLINIIAVQRRKIIDTPNIFLIAHVVSIFLAVVAGVFVASQYENFLLYKHQVPFGVVDPIFHKDVGFYVFSLPIFNCIMEQTLSSILVAVFGVWSIYVFQKKKMCNRDEVDRLTFNLFTHLSILGIGLMIVVIAYALVAKWNLLFSTQGAVFGAGWTDLHVQLPAYWALIVTAIVCSVLFGISAIAHSQKLTILCATGSACVFVVVWLIGVVALPEFIQWSVVSSNEIDKENQYIKHNIEFTRMAYGLTDDHLQQVFYPVTEEIGDDLVQKNHATFDSLRLWDFRVLNAIYSQKQIMRTYYAFPDVDVVRYDDDGKSIQLMCSLREMDHDRLPDKSKTWQNKHLFYTHGFGMVANPVNKFLPGGMPDFWLKDIPPVAKFDYLRIDEPRVYFGEMTKDHVFVNAKTEEFDFPQNESNITTQYTGTGGVAVGSWFRKFAFAWEIDGLKMLTSAEITPETRIMFDRDIATRVKKIAPFLQYDHDPYHVIADGKIFYIWDAYTVSKFFPYSEKSGEINYVRNSVKVVINVHSGEVDLYVFDEKDPIIQTYMKIFPDLFKSASAMPKALRKHVRYPEDLLSTQGQIYARYHMTNPTAFYNNEDKWSVAKEFIGSDKVGDVLPYYVTMQIPEETKEEFALILPFTPYSNPNEKNQRNNMVAWLAGRCDGENYGKLQVYSFPKDRFINGPMQIGTKINQDEVLKGQISLWQSKGSDVIFANLITLPLADHQLLYVQPIFLSASQGSMPELKRVVIMVGDQFAVGTSFEDALRKVIGNEDNVQQEVQTTDGERNEISGSDAELISRAAKNYARYCELTGQGKLGEAGQVLEELGQIINTLQGIKK